MERKKITGKTKRNLTNYGKVYRKKSFFLNLTKKAKSVNLFYIVSGLSQILLGAIVTMVSILNLVQPMWLAAFLSLLGCVVTMLGVYQVYEVFNSRQSIRDLARDAIERAINDKN